MEEFQETLSPCSSFSSYSSSSNPDPLLIDAELWLMMEQRAQEILCTIQPNVVSELRRKEVINYIQRLIKGYLGNDIFSFGSAPLKTYLPDGDIDLTALSHQNVEEDLATNVCSILKGQENSEFQVKDVQCIHAQVKIVKCTVKNIAVDISFNQLAGLVTLCFLEQVDQLIGKDHLFKRSVILIKSWCYYESRILCAHHGLISTYALETLVLYIINLFHGSLRGPLEVLYRFLEYYSTFDWDSHCVSINGPVAISSLTGVKSEKPEDDTVDELLLSKEFLKNCKDIFSVPIKAHEARVEEFPIKQLNILDPLKDNNNLGRSVGKGNFRRIVCAFSYGAQKLREILMLPGESVGGALEKFFINTLDRNGRGQRPDVHVPVPAFGIRRSEISDLSGDYDSFYGALQYGQWYRDCTLPVSLQPCSIPSQMWNESVFDALALSVRGNWNINLRKGTDVFVPRLQLCNPNDSQLSPSAFSIRKTRRSRGTGTYIPNMTRHIYREIHRGMKETIPESMHGCLSPKSAPKTDKVEVPSEINEGRNSSQLDLSLEEFPLLPYNAKPMPGQLATVKAKQVQHSSSPFTTINFGTYRNEDSDISYPRRPKKLFVPVNGGQKQEELSESNGETILIQPYRLEDDMDFPPLCF